MASFKLNLATIRGCPPAKELAEAIAAYGLPENDEFGVLNHSATDEAVFATVVRKSHQTVQRLNNETGEVTAEAVEKVNVYPIGVRPKSEVLEIYAGPVGGIEQMGIFFGSCLALPTVTEAIALDIPGAVARLAKNTERFQLRSIRVSEYAHNSFMAGPYAPKFLDSQHGVDFLDEYVDFVTAASVRFQGPSGRVNVTLSTKACFGFSCNDDDQPAVQSILRKLG